MQQRFGKYYSLESLHIIIEGYNNFRNMLQEIKHKPVDHNTWLEPNDHRRKKRGRQIIESTTAFNPS